MTMTCGRTLSGFTNVPCFGSEYLSAEGKCEPFLVLSAAFFRLAHDMAPCSSDQFIESSSWGQTCLPQFWQKIPHVLISCRFLLFSQSQGLTLIEWLRVCCSIGRRRCCCNSIGQMFCSNNLPDAVAQ